MSDDRSEDDPIMDLWYSNWEQQCVEALESEPDYENQLHNEKELYSQQMWTKFQTTASAIAQLYKGDSYVPAATYVSHTSDVTTSSPPPLARARRRRRPRGRLSRVTSVPGSREGYENDPPIRVAVSRHSRCRDSFVLVALGAVLYETIDPRTSPEITFNYHFTDRTLGVSLWVPFQTAAGTVTSLYKGACPSVLRSPLSTMTRR